jgi:hypothetical protein
MSVVSWLCYDLKFESLSSLQTKMPAWPTLPCPASREDEKTEEEEDENENIDAELDTATSNLIQPRPFGSSLSSRITANTAMTPLPPPPPQPAAAADRSWTVRRISARRTVSSRS